jgi:hypothetical protein
LLDNINYRLCTPILGPGVNRELLPSRADAAEALANFCDYPFVDRHDLAKVARFSAREKGPGPTRRRYVNFMRHTLPSTLGIELTADQKSKLSRATFSETAEALQWGQNIVKSRPKEIHHLLADLELPLYVTTNFDNFMVEALKASGRDPRRLSPRWIIPEGQGDRFALPEAPSSEKPVVLQLNGHDGNKEASEHMVLSEDDYMDHFVRLVRDLSSLLPSNVIPLLSENSLLFLGYRLDDWEFRVMIQGLIKAVERTDDNRNVQVGIQLDSDQLVNAEGAMQYLDKYLDKYNIDIYWGTTQQFVAELHQRWQHYLEGQGDEW